MKSQTKLWISTINVISTTMYTYMHVLYSAAINTTEMTDFNNHENGENYDKDKYMFHSTQYIQKNSFVLTTLHNMHDQYCMRIQLYQLTMSLAFIVCVLWFINETATPEWHLINPCSQCWEVFPRNGVGITIQHYLIKSCLTGGVFTMGNIRSEVIRHAT